MITRRGLFATIGAAIAGAKAAPVVAKCGFTVIPKGRFVTKVTGNIDKGTGIHIRHTRHETPSGEVRFRMDVLMGYGAFRPEDVVRIQA